MATDAVIIISWYLLATILTAAGPLTVWKHSRRFYRSLRSPNFAPSHGTFVLFSGIFIFLAATSGWLFQIEDDNNWSTSSTLVVTYLGVGFLYYPLLFVYNSYLLAFLSMAGAATLALIATVYLFLGSDLCGWLFLPSAVWSVFMTYLSLTFYLNTGEGTISLKEAQSIIKSSSTSIFFEEEKGDEEPFKGR